MARRTLTLTSLSAFLEDGDEPTPLDDIHGTSISALYTEWLRTLDPDSLVDVRKQRYVSLRRGHSGEHSILISAQYGGFGSEGETVDVATHEMRHEIGEGDAATFPTRLLFTAPPGATSAVFAIERQSNQGAGPLIARAFRDYLASEYPDHIFELETILQPENWIQNANLTEVIAVRHTVPFDPGHSLAGQPDLYGRVEVIFRPARGIRTIPKWVLSKLKGGYLTDRSVFKIGDEDIDDLEFKYKLEDGEQERTMVVDEERTPALRLLLSDHGDAALDDSAFITECRREMQNYYTRQKFTWRGSWLQTDLAHETDFLEGERETEA